MSAFSSSLHLSSSSTGPRHLMADMDPLLEQPIPASYIKLQDIVRSLAQKCSMEGRIPIYSQKDYM